MLLSDLNPHIRYACLHKSPLPARQEPSVCCDCRIFYFENIEGTFFVEGKCYNIINKTSVFLPPETEYKMDIVFRENPSFIVFNFDLTNINCQITKSVGTPLKSEFSKSLVFPHQPIAELSHPIIRTMPHIKRTLLQCVNNYILGNAFYKENSSALLKLCLLELLADSSHHEYSKLLKNVVEYIGENYTNPGLTNEAIARHFGYHPYHLGNIVKEETHKTLHQFIIYYRLRIAKELLTKSDDDICDISWKCGFGSAAYFTKQFRQNTGITPGQYRKRHASAGF